MLDFRSLLSLFVVITFSVAGCTEERSETVVEESQQMLNPERPNILLVVADDMGMLDIGAFGSEIRTPNIDRLAANGVSFTQFHTSAVCSPSRAMLLSGTDSHAAGLGNMVVHMAPNQRGAAGYEGYLSRNVVSVATLLQDAGYHTFMAGKWHLGMEEDLLPSRRGFDRAFALMDSGASYFSDGLGIVAKRPRATYTQDGQVVAKLPDDFYATEAYTDFVIEQIQSEEHSSKPFFAYLAYTAVHWPLQVRDEHLNLYQGVYDAGYEALRMQRIEKAKTLGIIKESTSVAPFVSQVSAWDDLSSNQQKQQSRVMELYAAVAERMDFHLGRVLRALAERGELENTVVIFLSDNGPDGSDRSKLPGNDVWLPEVMDMSYDNMGKPLSYVWAGPGWASASAGPSRRFKEFLTEGGIRSPMVISYPDGYSNGGISRDFVSIKDIAPTMLDFAGVAPPGDSYDGRAVEPMQGASIKPYLDGSTDQVHDQDYAMGWELFGQKAVYKDSWKLLWLTSKPKWLIPPEGTDQWALYNLANDPSEMNNLVESEPEKFEELLAVWKSYVEEQAVVLPRWE